MLLNSKKIQAEIDRKARNNVTNYKPHPSKITSQGDTVYVKSEETLYVKVGRDLIPIGGEHTSNTTNYYNTETSTGITKSWYSTTIDTIVELINADYRTLARQFGDIIEPIKIPVYSTSIKNINLYGCITNGTTIVKRFTDTLVLKETVIPTISATKKLIPNNVLDFAIKIGNLDRILRLRVRVLNERHDADESVVKKELIYRGKYQLEHDLMEQYRNNELSIILVIEILFNV